ncbi:hypothetical protein [Rhodococcus erythropolis]|uniref:hypothetical protein n=1 Tax=Rhodococcus erythropolis TaxID=1833 RepID=UPI001BE848D9|nr:hypothetical protein [Rhodococcus erythropolis]MBT2268967.1 hypothetical protein [Rhodococcus erythropolis]
MVTAVVVGRRIAIADRNSIIQGKYGVHDSFLFHSEQMTESNGVRAQQILARVHEAGCVGGKADMAIDVAMNLVDERISEKDGAQA